MPKNNLKSERSPTKNHDERHEYGEGSLWRNAKTGEVFMCLDGAANKAEWVPLLSPELAKVAISGSYEDLKDKPTLGDAAFRNVGTGAKEVAPGNDSRINGAVQKKNALSDINVKQALKNLGLDGFVGKLLRSKDAGSAQAVLEIRKGEDFLSPQQLDEHYQARSDALAMIVAVGELGLRLLGCQDEEDALEVLGTRVGVDVQPFSETLLQLSGGDPDAMAVFQQPSKSAIREVLELRPGLAFLPADEVRKMMAAVDKRLTKLEKKE